MNKPIDLIEIDYKLCTGCGYCVELCPQVFSLTSQGKAVILNIYGCNECDCLDVAEKCPVKAIYVERRE